MSEPASTVNPEELSGYLASRGWRREGTWRGAIVWGRESAGRVLIPSSLEYPDDSELLDEAVRKLATFEDRPQEEILLDIAEPLVDVQSYRLQPETPSGTIPLPSAIKAVHGIHDVLKFSARTVEAGPQLLFRDRRSKEVDGFLQGVRLGTTTPGSYIFHARVPVAPPGPDPLFGAPVVGRHVLTVLHTALQAAREAAVQVVELDRPPGVFDDYVEQGVSANLCAALAGLGGTGRSQPFEVTFSWARAEPISLSPAPIAFSAPMVRAISKASSELEALAKSETGTIIGRVETLRGRVRGEAPRIKIQGELRTASGSYRRAVWVVVGEADYQRAFHAQINERTLRVSGRLVPDQKRLELRPDGGLEVLPR
ncbi:hypothetical protein [Nonomuraea typhae]|uniref:hypothetical protein n=1 Tax=Nonomuraea typhae TaxID=2603600 RepID=UPI0012FA0A75|nr:hypothetical protein [Nonomuraea typhae]